MVMNLCADTALTQMDEYFVLIGFQATLLTLV